MLSEYADITRKSSGQFWSAVKRLFFAAGLVGLTVGLFVTGLERLIAVVWAMLLAHMTPVLIVVAPVVGLGLSGAFLQFTTDDAEVQGTEEYIAAYHGRRVLRLRAFPGRMLAAVSTLAFGGSAGLEGPSIYAGSMIGSRIARWLRRIGLTDADVRHLMVAGAAAGVSAIFKAPLTGIVFALEVPYRDDLVRESLVPSLIASVTSYLILVQFLGTSPLFAVSTLYTVAGRDLLWCLLIGLVVGIGARVFVASFHTFGALWRRLPFPLWLRTGLGGLLTGLFGLASLWALGTPAALGTGYDSVAMLLSGQWAGWKAVILLVLKAGAVLATLSSGAAGGIFIPMIVLGASFGSAVGGLAPDGMRPLFPVVGMSAFLAAGYNTPLAAAVFIAESTGGAGYLIPGLLAGAVAYTVAGRVSVSEEQRWRRESGIERIMRMRVRDLMTHDVVGVDAGTSVQRFVTDAVTSYRHKSLPVTDADGRLVGMIGLTDVQHVDPAARATTPISEAMSTDLITTTTATSIGALVAEMSERDVDRVPVVAADDPGRLVGIISTSDILGIDRFTSSRWVETGDRNS